MPRYKHELTARPAFDAALAAGRSARDLGFDATDGDVRRFIARYRVARAFRGLDLDGFSPRTAEGYTALFRLFLAWSAFEQFLRITGQSQRHVKRLFDAYDAPALCATIRRYDRGNAFYLFVVEHVNPTHRAEIEKHLSGQELNSSYLASAVRHIFAHGALTPHANRSYTRNVCRICDEIAAFLLRILDAEFSRRVTGGG